MKPENFIAFFTVCGFFVGFVFVLINIDDAVDTIVYTLIITFAFYIIIHVLIMFFVDINKVGAKIFAKQKYEDASNSFISELSVREKKMENILVKLDEEREFLKKNEAIERRRNARAKRAAARKRAAAEAA